MVHKPKKYRWKVRKYENKKKVDCMMIELRRKAQITIPKEIINELNLQ